MKFKTVTKADKRRLKAIHDRIDKLEGERDKIKERIVETRFPCRVGDIISLRTNRGFPEKGFVVNCSILTSEDSMVVVSRIGYRRMKGKVIQRTWLWTRRLDDITVCVKSVSKKSCNFCGFLAYFMQIPASESQRAVCISLIMKELQC